MRVGPLSNDKIIDLLSKYFVPVWLSNDHFQLTAPSDAEQQEVQRIYQERVRRRLDSGTVCVVILAPDGGVAATLNLHKASQTEILAPFLQQIVDDRKLAPRSAEVVRNMTAAPLAATKPRTEGGLVLHVLTRFEEMKPNRGVSQDWYEWTAAEWSALAPPTDAQPGAVQTMPKDAADKLFRRLYPPAGAWDPSKCKVVAARLRSTVVGAADGEVRLKLDAEAQMTVPVGDDPTGGKVTVQLVGAARYDASKRTFTSLSLASESAEFVRYWNGAAFPGKMIVGLELEK